MVTIKDISAASGYSQATISRLFKGDESLSITPDTKKHIISTALSMGYDRSKIKTTLYKIAIPFFLNRAQVIQDMYFTQVQNALLKFGKEANMEIQFITDRFQLAQLPEDITGFIGVGDLTHDDLMILKQKGLKGVLLEINLCPKHFDTVKPDTDSMTRDAIDEFLTAGFTRIGFIGGTYRNPQTGKEELDSRERVFRDYLTSKGLLQEQYIYSEGLFSIDEGYQLASDMVHQLGDALPEACFIASDTLAIGALQAFNELGIKLPGQLAIISINDNEIAQFVSPPLTTYRIDVEEMAKTAIELLADQLTYPRRITKTVLLGSELIYRKSFVKREKQQQN
ncbi:LacI family DNA-binding transcriptional regulator [Enterococcus diestrammenae]|uniref:LacI family transcriptional regulator n=1 Tax=Enterococcus diestrammenae TaxID=1155073 RepID=A0ABV0F4V1_9ENTE|nr:LacI family DNA-binding transcriptional regulator [Enterococcus diestrammenae]KAF1300647.1 LacI family transcriptional regulator [Enterococcus diestrammenae]